MESRLAPVEVTTRFATTVPDLASAWAFVMSRIDMLGSSPSISISPVWVLDSDGDRENPPRHFEVVVSGMSEESA